MSTAQSKTPYIDLYKAYEQQSKQKGDTYKANVENQFNTSKKAVEQDFDKGAQEQYINYKQGEKALPEQLNKVGIGGGAAESSLIRLKSAYGGTLGDLEANKNTNIGGLESTRLQNITDYEAKAKQDLNNAYSSYMQKQAEYDQKLKAADLNTFLDTYQDIYQSSGAAQRAIDSLASSNDINKSEKIQYLRGLFSVLSVQEKAQQEAIAKAYRASSASSGGSGGGGGGGGGSTPDIDPVALNSLFPSPTKSASQTIIDQFGRGPLNKYNKKR